MEETQKIPIREVGAKDKEYPEKIASVYWNAGEVIYQR